MIVFFATLALALAEKPDDAPTQAAIACSYAVRELRIREAQTLDQLKAEHPHLKPKNYERKLIADAIDRCIGKITADQVELANESVSKNWDTLQGVVAFKSEGIETKADIKLTDKQKKLHKQLKMWYKTQQTEMQRDL